MDSWWSRRLLATVCFWIFLCAHELNCAASNVSSSASSASAGAVGTASAGSSSGHGGHHIHPHDALLFMFVTLFFGCILSLLISRLLPSLPYTVCVYILGMIAGIIEHVVRDGATTPPNAFSESLLMWKSIDPHLMLHAFLPALLFGDSLNVNKHQAWKCQGACGLLATVGVVYGASMTALVLYYICPVSFTWNESMTAGSIMAATDPVAVVAILKALGAPEKLNMLVSGESLMNDGVAIVVYKIFHEMSLGEYYSFGDMVAFFLKLFFGGIGLGLLFGWLTLAVLHLSSDKLQHDDNLIQTSAMFACAYLSFWLAESKSVGVSGVLANVVAALTVGFYGKSVWVDRGGVQHVFHWVEYAGNTLLFMLAGVIVGGLIMSDDVKLGAADWGWLPALYVFGLLIRALVVFSFFPLLHKMGAKVSWQEAVVMVWGGLRGAVGLALAVEVAHISVDLNKNQLSADELQRRQLILFQCSMFTTLTLLVNAPTTGMVVRKLGLVQEPAAAAVNRLCLEKRLADGARSFYEKNKKHPVFLTFNEEVCDKVMDEIAHAPPPEKFEKTIANIDSKDIVSFQRQCFLRLVNAQYWRMHDAGIIPPQFDCRQQLCESVEYAYDHIKDGLLDWSYVKKEFLSYLPWFEKWRRRGRLGWFLGQFNYEMFTYEVVLFIAGHRLAQDQARDMLAKGDALTRVIEESNANIEQAEKWLEQRNSTLVERTRTYNLIAAVMTNRSHEIHKLQEKGAVSSMEAHHLHHHGAKQVWEVCMQYFTPPHSSKPRRIWPSQHVERELRKLDGASASVEWDGYE